MKATELRIGNWFNDVGSQPFQIMPNDILGLYQCEAIGKIHLGINPIKLTKELLIKFGFEMDGIFTAIYKYKHLLFEFRGDSIRLCQEVEVEDDGTDFYGISPWFRSVHQLQNLYFGLTGEELEIK